MRIKIKGVEIFVENMEELDGLIERYGSDVTTDSAAKPSTQPRRNSGSRLDTHDRVVLQRFVEAGVAGVPTSELGKLLGKGGRGTRRAAQRWAVRVGLVSNETMKWFDEVRIGSQRGLRIEAAYMGVAKELL